MNYKFTNTTRHFAKNGTSIARFGARTLAVAGVMLAGITPSFALELHSSDFAPNGTLAQQQVFNGFGCTGENISPTLEWSDVPDGTQSFALMVHDPAAPTGSGWWHWVVIDIPASMRSLPQNAGAVASTATMANDSKGTVGSMGAMRQLKTDFGQPGYGGPCPPLGDAPHPYNFTLFALDVPKIDVDDTASAALVGYMVHGHTIASTTLTGLYGRKAQ
ncbi:YbhB/YbcL family Raf kinase inhibitor-like protein [Thalassospira marina]|uniref:YbhB/YbcL family Raf kinase inhibitor-like protein n=1 Tax=Thalassospira marina TaxID=2048283 RepID=UPI001FE4CE62|nr:YbhB/YbcL family Raf kinase inhibitor-like protein [Thalassospira marina]